MAGKMTDGTDNQYNFRNCKAYSEGVYARYAAAIPVNPHGSTTPEGIAWAAGAADAVTGVAAIDACVAIPAGAIAT